MSAAVPHAARAILQAEIQGRAAFPIATAGAAERLLGLAALPLRDALPGVGFTVVRDALVRERATTESMGAVAAVLAGDRAKALAGGSGPDADSSIRTLLVRGAGAAKIPLHGEVAGASLRVAAMTERAIRILPAACAGKAKPILELGLRFADEAARAGGVPRADDGAELAPYGAVTEAFPTGGG